MVRLGLSFYDLRTSQYSSDEEYGPDYFVIGAPKSEEVLANSVLSFEIRCAGVNILEEVVVDGATRFVEVEAVEADYSGMSGGGLWEISYPASGGQRVFLMGVVVRSPNGFNQPRILARLLDYLRFDVAHDNQLKSCLQGLVPRFRGGSTQ